MQQEEIIPGKRLNDYSMYGSFTCRIFFVILNLVKMLTRSLETEWRKWMSRLNDLGSKISKCRQDKNLTQEELAIRIGVTPQAVSKWERSQSIPDILILADLCRILDVSADFLLGIESRKITENGDKKIQDDIWKCLRNCLEPLELIFGEKLVPAVMDYPFMEMIIEQRKKLAEDGILMPVVRVRDDLRLKENEFMILSYQNVLYLEQIAPTETACQYMIGKLGEVVRTQYVDIINRDLVKSLVDNLQIRYPALITGTVPEHISYGLLTDVVKKLMERGDSIIYLEKIIENMDSILREYPKIPFDEIVKKIAGMLETKNNIWIFLHERE